MKRAWSRLKGTIRICPSCKKEFEPHFKNQVSCSIECGHKSRTEKQTTSTKERICKNCGKHFYAKEDRKTYCSRECAFKDYKNWQNPLEKQKWPQCKLNYNECQICGKEFITNHPNNYCSKCRKEGYREASRQWSRIKYYRNNKLVERNCPECGKLFKIFETNKTRKYCSLKCGEKVARRNGKATNRARGRRLNRIYETEKERIKLNEIYLRDGGKCQLCHKKVYLKYKFPHRQCAVLDHIKPLAKGGEHRKRNIQLAHNICNAYKCAELGFQMRLFG